MTATKDTIYAFEHTHTHTPLGNIKSRNFAIRHIPVIWLI